MRRWLVIALLPLSIARAAPDTDYVPPPAGANVQCPVMTDEKSDGRYSTTNEGRTIYFCCGKCRRKFNANPSAYLQHLGAIVAAPAPSGVSKSVPRFVAYAGKFHPLIVHFPIALLLVGGVSELVRSLRRIPSLHPATTYFVNAAVIFAPLAAALGWANAAAFHATNTDATLLLYHRWLGITTATLAVVAFFVSRAGCVRALRVLLVASAIAVAVTGHLGGLLAYGADYFSKL